MKRHRRLDDPRDELGPAARVVEPLVLRVERLDRLALAAERLHDRVAGVHLLDVAVERAGRRPLGDELLLRAADDEDRDGQRRRARRAARSTARIGLISSIMISTPTIVSSDVISWVRLCWSDWPMLSMSFVTRLSRSPRGWLSK